LEKEATGGHANGSNGVEAKTEVVSSNGHSNGNGVEAKTGGLASNGNGFRYNEYDGKA
jgi:sulfonate dioxygenase